MTVRAVMTAWWAAAQAACDGASRCAAAQAEPTIAGALADRPRWLLALGKTAVEDAVAWHAAGPIARALVVAPRGTWAQASAVQLAGAGAICVAATHPRPSAASQAAAQVARAFVLAVPADAVLVVAISGGASSLLADTAAGRLEAKAALIHHLIAAGAPIDQVNQVRAALSTVKAGRLTARCAAPVVTVIASDVPDDVPHRVGSGPSVPWPMPGDAAAVLAAHQLALPPWAAAGLAGPWPVSRPGDVVRVIAPRQTFALALAQAARAGGIHVHALGPCLDGDADHQVVPRLAQAVHAAAPGSWLVGFGEAQVHLPANAPPGGRARHLALGLAAHLRASPRAWTALFAGTDGQDGDAAAGPIAGGFSDHRTAARTAASGFDLAAERTGAGAARVLAALGDAFRTGLTGCNHADAIVLWCGDVISGEGA